MKQSRFIVIAVLSTALSAGVALASWYDDYDAGLSAAKKGQWQTVVQKMTSAISGNPKEANSARTYGAIFINYHPYYYRAVAYLNTGKYQQAVKDFETTSGPGPDDYGPIEELIQRAKTRLAEAEKPEPPTPKPPVPTITTTTPVVPTIDNALRTRARASLDQAKTRIQAAQQRKATAAPQYQSALTAYTEANTRLATAKSNDDLNAVIAAADNISLLADSATAPGIPIVTPTTTHPIQTRTGGATEATLADTRNRLRHALEAYFNGDFDIAVQQFQSLTRDLPNNGWIWAFLGASQYSQYAFEADETYKAAAIDSFRKAKTYGKWKDGLPEKYFSRKIRKAFKDTAG